MPADSNPSLSNAVVTEGIIDALHWCRLGRVRPKDDADFHRAKELGLLAQDPIWRTTPAGECVLARQRPEAYGARAFSIECPHCFAAPAEQCRDFRPREKYQLCHSKRMRRAPGERGWGS
jgi:hypothetical protein